MLGVREHLLAACMTVVDALLDTEIRILCTSREGLGVTGERLYAARRLSVPQAEGSRDAISRKTVRIWRRVRIA